MSNNKTEEHKNKYVSYVPMSKNNTMTNMYRTILLVLLALLLLAACADDVTPTAEPADTLAGQPVRFTATGLAITPAGVTQTKADADFTTMTVYMTDTDGNTWQADYTYNETNSTWQADDEPLYWPTSTDQYTFTAISPAGTDPHITLPATWTEADLTKHEAIRATYGASTVTPSRSPVSLTLRPALTKVQVVSISGQPVSLIDAPMAGTLDLEGGCEETTTGLMTLYSPDNIVSEGYVLPAGKGFGFLSDKVYKVDTELEAGTVVTTWDDTEAVLINCPTPGELEDVWPNSTPEKVVITGTLNDDDLETINGHKGDIVNLYVMGGKTEDAGWNTLNMGYEATQLELVYLAEATSIGNGAFSNCSALKSISLPKATNIGTSAFNRCTQLTTVSLPKAESIGVSAFLSCSELTTVSLPQAKYIESSAFTSCTGLTTISLPKAESIGGNAFMGCTTLASICLPKDANIGTSTFLCPNLTTLFLSDENTTEEEAKAFISKISTLTTIHYGYTGTDGDYLKESNYAHHWPTN